MIFIAWSLALFRRLTRTPWLAASFAAVLFLGLQTDVIGIPWIAVVVWALAGDEVYRIGHVVARRSVTTAQRLRTRTLALRARCS